MFNGNAWMAISGDTAASGPSTSSLAVGKSFLGGTIAYIYKQGDSGYVSGEVHGIIATTTDIGYDAGSYTASTFPWTIGGIQVATNATNGGVGQGNTNTNLIFAAQGRGSYAADTCKALSVGGTGWYLPDVDEMSVLYNKAFIIGGFEGMAYNSSKKTWSVSGKLGTYWTSNAALSDIPGNNTEDTSKAKSFNLSSGTDASAGRAQTYAVRPIKKF